MAKKYKLHKITEKEAAKIAEQCEIPESKLNGDCYCLVNKKGKMCECNGVSYVFKGTATKVSNAEQSFTRAIQAALYFKDFSHANDIEFKIPKTADLLSGDLADKKLKMPDSYNVAVVVGNDRDAEVFKKIEEIFEKIDALRDDIKSAPHMAVHFDFDPNEYDERDEEDYDDYNEDGDYEDEEDYDEEEPDEFDEDEEYDEDEMEQE